MILQLNQHINYSIISNNGVTYETNDWDGTNKHKAIKQYNSVSNYWWLRQAFSIRGDGFQTIDTIGGFRRYSACDNYGVAPAFRIG